MEPTKTPAPLKPLEVVRILRKHNLWRRGRSHHKPTDPTMLGQALARAVQLIEAQCKSRPRPIADRNGMS